LNTWKLKITEQAFVAKMALGSKYYKETGICVDAKARFITLYK